MTYTLNGDSAAAQIASTTDRSMLRQIIAAVAQLTGAPSAYMEHCGNGGEPRVVASYGPEAPSVGTTARCTPDVRSPLILPLAIDGRTVGAIVCLDAPREVVLDPTRPGQIELLATLAAAALRNVALAEELELATAAGIEQRFRLLNGLVHYLKNTLGAAGEYVQLIGTESELTQRQTSYAKSSQRNIDVALRLLTELIDLGRVETGRLTVQRQPIDPALVVRGIVRDYELSNGMSGVHFDLAMDGPLPTLDTDVDLMRRILDTLLSNAVKYTPAGGRVHVTADVRAGRRTGDASEFVCITVTDEGPGVADSDKVFDEVLRAECAGTTPGFRLAIGRRIARLLDGDLSLDAHTPPGSSFTLWLPIS